MNQRQQYLKYYSRLLGWISAEQLQQLSQENITFEEFAESNHLFTSGQWDGLQFILMNLSFLKVAQDLNFLQAGQAEILLNEKISEIREGKLIADLKPLQQKMIPLQAIAQIVSRMRQQNILTDQELTKILKIIQPYYAQAKPQTVPKAQEKSINTLKTLGNYQIISEIGAGGMGKVYKAYDPKLDRTVAIKVMLNQSSEIARQRFLSEARLTARLQHPNIIAIHDINSQNDMDYIVMDFVVGKPLDGILSNEKISIGKAIRIMRSVASAMGYAHDNNIIHRDLKPANILMETTNDRPIIMDFGLAKNIEFSDGVTRTGQILGTPRYMAPEQTDAKPPTPLVDIYALGAILYEMLTGTPAVTGETMAQIIFQITQKKVVAPREINPDIPEYLEKICLKAMAKNPEERYQSAHDLAIALKQIPKDNTTIGKRIDQSKQTTTTGKKQTTTTGKKRSDKSNKVNRTVSPKPRTKAIDKSSVRSQKKTKQKTPVVLWSSILGLLVVMLFIWKFSATPQNSLDNQAEEFKQKLAEQQQLLEQQQKLLEQQNQRIQAEQAKKEAEQQKKLEEQNKQIQAEQRQKAEKEAQQKQLEQEKLLEEKRQLEEKIKRLEEEKQQAQATKLQEEEKQRQDTQVEESKTQSQNYTEYIPVEWINNSASQAEGKAKNINVKLLRVTDNTKAGYIVNIVKNSPIFSERFYTPKFTSSDYLNIEAAKEYPVYELQFSESVENPILHLDSFYSVINFEENTKLKKISGILGEIKGSTIPQKNPGKYSSSSGSVQILGKHKTIKFAAFHPHVVHRLRLQVVLKDDK